MLHSVKSIEPEILMTDNFLLIDRWEFHSFGSSASIAI